MRKAIVICGANGDRGLILERLMEDFMSKHSGQVLVYSACTVANAPIVLEMSGVESVISLNGCPRKCCDIILGKNNVTCKKSVVLDDIIDDHMPPCRPTTEFSDIQVKDEDCARFNEMLIG